MADKRHALPTPTYTNIVTTIICALLVWFGSQVVDLTVKLARIETDVINIRHSILDSQQARNERDIDFEQRIRALEAEQREQAARLQERVP